MLIPEQQTETNLPRRDLDIEKEQSTVGYRVSEVELTTDTSIERSGN